jgi:hypothetical protein
MLHSTHKYHSYHCGSISISTLIVIGTAIIAFSMILAVVIVAVRDARASRIGLHKDEEGRLLEDEELLPPYEHPPPAYVAELDSGVDALSLDPIKVNFKGASANELV